MIGYVVCAALLALCVLLVICAASFGSKNTVDVFGFNIFIAQNGDVPNVPENSAVFVKKCSAYDLVEGNLALYMTDESEISKLGYVKKIYVQDGAYYVTVTDNGKPYDFPEAKLIGRADYNSAVIGAVVGFIKTPFGIFCMAFMPCIALVLYDIIRAFAAKMPLPEVEPQIKNPAEEPVKPAAGISVKSDGKAAYSRASGHNSSESAGDVLFTYSGKQRKAERPIIPLTDKRSKTESDIKLPEKPSSGYAGIAGGEELKNQSKKPNPGSIRREIAKTPSSVALGRYSQNVHGVIGKTAELPEIPRKNTSDAFFAQTDTPSFIDKGREAGIGAARGQAPQIRRISDDESDEETKTEIPRTAKTSGKRSSQILASKRVEDLISDDEDFRDKGRINDSVVDDILSGLEHKQ